MVLTPTYPYNANTGLYQLKLAGKLNGTYVLMSEYNSESWPSDQGEVLRILGSDI